jgi:hypothetical protein
MADPTPTRLVAVNAAGHRIGEGHHRAILTDHEVDLMLALLDEREALLERCQREGRTRSQTDKELNVCRLSFGMLAIAFEVSKAAVVAIHRGDRRGQITAGWKRVK